MTPTARLTICAGQTTTSATGALVRAAGAVAVTRAAAACDDHAVL